MKGPTGNLPEKAVARTRKTSSLVPPTLAIDIGGSRVKATVLDGEGEMLAERVRVETPDPCPPEVLVATIKKLIAPLPEFGRASVGFPGVVRHGKVMAAHNLGTELWRGFDLGRALGQLFKKPVRVINDADMQGLGAISGTGVELVITLGTGFGSSLFEDGGIAPHLELAHAPFRNGQTYEEQLGIHALEEVGKKRWNRRLQRAIKTLRTLTNFDHLYIGGGNSELVSFQLAPDISIVPNTLGMIGGIWLWRDRHASEPR
ncbi:MAG: ROK family protein [Acidobacteriota bacterium]